MKIRLFGVERAGAILGGTGPFPLPCIPGSRPFLLSFVHFTFIWLQNIKHCWVIFPFFCRYTHPYRTPTSRPFLSRNPPLRPPINPGFQLTGRTNRGRTPSRREKRCPYLELAAYENVKIQSLYGSWEKRGSVSVRRASTVVELPILTNPTRGPQG